MRDSNPPGPIEHGALPSGVQGILARDPELRLALDEVDRSLIVLAMDRTVRERLRAGVAMARLAARFRR